MTETPRWTPDDYGSHIRGSAAEKLTLSAVAPLVALSAGMVSITSENVADVATSMGLGTDNRSASMRSLSGSLTPDAMAMPWFSARELAAWHRAIRMGIKDADIQATSAQWRPAKPVMNKDKKPAKYLFASDSDTTIGVHPATPDEWVREAKNVLIAEGMLKGYSALTAWLVENGISAKNLGLSDPDMTVRGAREELNALMSSVEGDPLLLLLIPGVGNWHRKAEWTDLVVKNRDFMIAFDGDMATNLNVWAQGSMLRSALAERGKAASVTFLTPSVEGDSKAGVDDYLASGKSWTDLVETASPKMPVRPDGAASVGDLRMNPTLHVLEKYVEVDGATMWVPHYPMFGRISQVIESKSATWHDPELRNGVIDPQRADRGSEASIEFLVSESIDAAEASGDEVEDPTDDTKVLRMGTVTGPHELAASSPERWHLVPDARLSPRVTTSPNWPPNMEWLRAAKQHAPEKTVRSSRWKHMGYVPSSQQGALPVFISGNKVITADGVETDSDHATPGVTREFLDNAERYGANDHDASGEDYRKAVAADIETLIGEFTCGAWNDPRIPAVIIGTALRPAIPSRPALSVVFSGPSNSGKTWSARHILAFWADSAGIHPMGSARDTSLAGEIVLSQTPLWLSDDLAAQADKQAAIRNENTIGELIRSVKEGNSKNRGTPGMKMAAQHPPRAVFVVTAENDFDNESQLNRALMVSVSRGFLAEDRSLTDRVARLSNETVVANRVTTALIRYLINQAGTTTPVGGKTPWRTFVEQWEDTAEEMRALAARRMSDSGNTARMAEIAREPMVALQALADLADWAGVSEPVQVQIEEMLEQVIEFAARNYVVRAGDTLAHRMVRAVATMLRAGQAHVVSPSGGPPVVDGNVKYPNAHYWNQQCGWRLQDGEYRPNGLTIGTAFPGDDGSMILMLDPQTAFNEAARHQASLVLAGTKQQQAWQSVASEDKIHPSFVGSRPDRGRYRKSVDGQTYRGIPLLLDDLAEA